VLVAALQLQVPPATNLAGCTEVNGKGINHKFVPGTGLLLDLVAMLITDVHAKWTAGLPAGAARAPSCRPAARDFLFVTARAHRTRHALPSPANDQYHHQPYQLLRSGRILAKSAKHSIGRPIPIYRSPGCRLESGGTENRLAAIAAQILRHFLALRYDQFNSFRFTGKCDAPRFILNGAVWNSALAGRAVGRP
jgi:hypothetical protein